MLMTLYSEFQSHIETLLLVLTKLSTWLGSLIMPTPASRLLSNGVWRIERTVIDEDEPPVIEYVCKPEGCVEPLCRMPQLLTETTTSRRSNRTKTRLLNLPEIALSINRPESHLLAFLALHNNATAGADRHGTFFIGSFSSRLLQASVMEFLEKYVVCGVTGSPSTIIATVVGRNGERKLRLKGPTSEGNLSAKKCGHSYAGMLDVVARDPMPEAEQMAVRWLWRVGCLAQNYTIHSESQMLVPQVLYSEHAMMHPNPGIPPMRSLRAIIKSAAALRGTPYWVSPVGSVTPAQVGADLLGQRPYLCI